MWSLALIFIVTWQMHDPIDCAVVNKEPSPEGTRELLQRSKRDIQEEVSYFDMWNHKRNADPNRNDWILVQYRKFNNSNTDEFQNANWERYQNGFGNPEENVYWMGLERMHHMTSSGSWRLLLVVQGEGPANMFNFIIYDNVTIGSKQDKYPLKLGSVEEKYGIFEKKDNSYVMYFNGKKFSTKDQDNDASSGHCSKSCQAGWWYNNCYYYNLNGRRNEILTSTVKFDVVPSATKMGLRRVP